LGNSRGRGAVIGIEGHGLCMPQEPTSLATE
jgi:hypothetical protein